MSKVEYIYVPPHKKKSIDELLREPWPRVVNIDIPRKKKDE